MQAPLDLTLHLALPPTSPLPIATPLPDAPTALATITLRYDTLGLQHQGDILMSVITPEEAANLRWYLEDYWRWPYEQFADRAKQIEAQLPIIGKRLYQAVFGSAGAQAIVQAWRLQPLAADQDRQISIVSDLPTVLNLPWELLHDEQGFLALRAGHPVSIVRRLQQREAAALQSNFEPPLRILLITARPDDAGFVNPRSIARELLHAIDEPVQEGQMIVEFLRPPTLSALSTRLNNTKLPAIHVLHFDGHGAFGEARVADDGLLLQNQGVAGPQGMLAFEDDQGREQLVTAEALRQVLQGSSVKLALFNACQSAQGATDDAFSSVATRLIQGGVDAVIAMSASVLVATATRYVSAFYAALADGLPVPAAQERARQFLAADPRRHVSSRTDQDEGSPVELRDWWLPHLYQQRSVVLRSTTAQLQAAQLAATRKRKKATPTTQTFNNAMPAEPRYGFTGRALELLKIERALLQKRLVVIHGFGGMGKTALAREAADWLTRTKLYQRACFVSFEQGSDATVLLSTLGHFLDIANAQYNPAATQDALARIKPAIKKQPLLLIADNLESILPNGEAVLDLPQREQLWDVLLKLREMGVGVLLTSRDTNFGDARLAQGKHVLHLPLRGLAPYDAYTFAITLLQDLGIPRKRAPYEPLCDLLNALDRHPLAMQLVLPHLNKRSLDNIQSDFTTLLPNFSDDTVTGRNASLLASLEYSLRRLTPEQRALLSRFAVFEGGAQESSLLAITEISEAEWATLRPALEQAALLTAEHLHEELIYPFLHFHPVLIPYLRSQQTNEEPALQQRYIQRYSALANYYGEQDNQHPQAVRAIVQRELPNLRRTWNLLIQTGEIDAAASMADYLTHFLTGFGRLRERDALRSRLAERMKVQPATEGVLTRAVYLHELGLAEDEKKKGRVRDAIVRLQYLLARIEAQSEGMPRGHGSFEHCHVLHELAECFYAGGQSAMAEKWLHEALVFNNALYAQEPDNSIFIGQRASLLNNLGNVQREQGKYTLAHASYEESLKLYQSIQDQYNQAVVSGQLGTLSVRERNYVEARSRYQDARELFHALGESVQEAGAWHNLGYIADDLQEWGEAEHCYRESLVLNERLGNAKDAAKTCNALGKIARQTGHASEAEGWYRRALILVEHMEAESPDHAMILSNFANLLLNEVRTGRAAQSRLQEAQDYMEHVRQIEEQPGILAMEGWETYNILAGIAELQGQSEQMQTYRRRERESFAAFEGNRYHIDRQHKALIRDIAAVARGDAETKAAIEEALPTLEQNGWHISTAVQRIWAGERDWHALADGLHREVALLILRVLETLAAPEDAPAVDASEELTLEQMGASLPPAFVAAMEQGDEAAVQRVFAGLTAEEQARVVAVMEALQGGEQGQSEEEDE